MTNINNETQAQLNALIATIERKSHHARERVMQTKQAHKQKEMSGATLTKHAGWNLGYWEGRASALEDTLDSLYEMKNGSVNES